MYEDKVKLLRMLANGDEKYRQIRQRYTALEEEFAQIAAQLPDCQQDILWAFVITSDELDHRLIEILCDYIHFG